MNPQPAAEFLIPLSQEPRKGQKVELVMKDGSIKTARACLMHVPEGGSYMQYFHSRKAIPYRRIKGWRALEIVG